MQDLDKLVRDYLKLRSQADLASAAKVHQSTVSRALRGLPEKHGRARARLWNYLSKNARRKEADLDREIENAIANYWDGTRSHAKAIVRLVEALADLKPRRSGARGKG